MSSEAEKARKYLQEKEIPLIFESLMTGLMCNKPDDAIDFMMCALYALKTDPTIKLTWETFVEKPPPSVSLTARKSTPVGEIAHVDVVGLLSKAIEKYGESHDEWKEAKAQFSQGYFVATQSLVKLIRSKLIGQVCQAIIVDYDQNELKNQLSTKYSDEAMRSACLESYISGILNATKYFDERQLLTIIPGEQTDAAILEQLHNAIKKSVEFAEGTKDREAEQVEQPIKGSRTSTARSDSKIISPDEAAVVAMAPEEASEQAPESSQKNTPSESGEPAVDSALEQDQSKQKSVTEYQAEKKSPTSVAAQQQPVFERPPVVLVVGAPGSLKLSYCDKLAQKYEGFVLLSMGKLLAQAISEHPNDESVCQAVLSEALLQVKNAWGYIIEGYPRDLLQMHDLDKMVRLH
ncbi:unnamed protein product [Soboliphyme baturini]|uniref:Adenylate kinase n=1 Tax=Soboliphyme baturini TaxID=241478 RepID=A0A183IQ73_9BILA|nr:unnamed protein product [Soboliphyme baturini]